MLKHMEKWKLFNIIVIICDTLNVKECITVWWTLKIESKVSKFTLFEKNGFRVQKWLGRFNPLRQ